MSNLPPREGSPLGSESLQESVEQQLMALLEKALISKKVTLLIKKDLFQDPPIVSARGQQWLKTRLESIIGSTNEITRKAFKSALQNDWELNRSVP